MIKNGQITNTWMGCHEGFWFLEITIEFGVCMVQHRISLYEPTKIVELFKLLEVTDYNDIKGCYVRVKTNGTRTFGIANIVKDEWILW